MMPVTSSAQGFLVRWLAHLSERSIRLHYYLARLAVSAPRTGGQPPPVIAMMIREVKGFAEDVRRSAALISEIPERDFQDQDILIAYKNCAEYVRRFLKLHARLSHLPKDWVRSEVELFLNSVGSGLNDEVVKLIGGKRRLLESYSVVSTPIYNFANLLDDQGYRTIDEDDSSGAARDLLSIPTVEQHNTLFWPILIHELAHSIPENFGIGVDSKVLDFIDRHIDRKLWDQIKGWWLPEIFCDLFACAITGPIYAISMTLFSLFWVPDPIKRPAKTHPSPDVRLSYISNFLKRTNPEFMSAIAPELEALTAARKTLDYKYEMDDVQYIQLSIDRGETPSEDNIIQLAGILSESPDFLRLTQPHYRAEVRRIRDLQDRVARGEFIGTSRQSPSPGLARPSAQNVYDHFEQYASQLVEKPNSILDILTAIACFQSRLLLEKDQYDELTRTEKTPQFPTMFIVNYLRASFRGVEFISHATEFIHDADATAIKSLEGSELGRFFASEP